MKAKTVAFFFLITIMFIGGCQTGSENNNENTPTSINMTFTIYNNMTGQLGAFTESATSGTSFKLHLGEIISQFGVINVDPSRFVLRKTSSVEENGNQNIGDYVADSVRQDSPGIITITVPTEEIKYDIFLVSNLLLSEGFLDELDITLPESVQSGKKNFITAKRVDWAESDGPEYIFKNPDNPSLGIYNQINNSLKKNWKDETTGRERFIFGFIDYKGETSETTDMRGGYDNLTNWIVSYGDDWFAINRSDVYSNSTSIIDRTLRERGLMGCLKVFYGNEDWSDGGAIPSGMIEQGLITAKGIEINAYYAIMLDNTDN